jgi:VanZ family protein
MRAMASVEKAVRWLPAVCWMALIFWLSSRSALPPPPALSYTIAAVTGHFLMFYVLTVLILVGLGSSRRPSPRQLMAAGAFALLYGVSDELHQSLVPGRDASISDLAVDTTGIVFALGNWVMLWRRA